MYTRETWPHQNILTETLLLLTHENNNVVMNNGHAYDDFLNSCTRRFAGSDNIDDLRADVFHHSDTDNKHRKSGNIALRHWSHHDQPPRRRWVGVWRQRRCGRGVCLHNLAQRGTWPCRKSHCHEVSIFNIRTHFLYLQIYEQLSYFWIANQSSFETHPFYRTQQPKTTLYNSMPPHTAAIASSI